MTRRFGPMVAAVAFLLGASLLAPTAAVAAGGRQGGGQPGQRLKAALAQLDLSAGQKTQIKQIMADAKPAANVAGQAGAATRSKGAGRAIVEKVMAVLTPQQKTKLRQILQSARSQRGAGKA